MSFIINGITNVFFEVMAKILDLCITSTYSLSLQIGTGSQTKTKEGLVVQKGDAFANVFSGAKEFQTVFFITAFVLLFTIFILKLIAANFAPLTGSTEEPIALVFLTVIASLGVIFSYRIFRIFQAMANRILTEFKSVKKPSFKKGDFYDAVGSNPNRLFGNGDIKGYKQSSNPWDKTVYGRKENGGMDGDGSITTSIVGFIVFFVITMQFLRLFLEMFERYVVLALMFYTAPLAFATICSRSTMGIFTNWLKMLTSQFLLMFMNVFFLNVFAKSFHSIISRATDNTYLFADFNEFIFYTMLWIGWLIVGQRVDQHLQSLGMSTAQSGGGLASAVIAAGGTAMMAARGAVGVVKGVGSRGAAAGKASSQTFAETGSAGAAFATGAASMFRNPKNVSAETSKRSAAYKEAKADLGSAQKSFYASNGTDIKSAMGSLNSKVGMSGGVNTTEGKTIKDMAEASGAMDALKAQEGFNPDSVSHWSAKDGTITATDNRGQQFSVSDMSKVNPRTDGAYKSVQPSAEIKSKAESQGVNEPIWGYKQSFEDVSAESTLAMSELASNDSTFIQSESVVQNDDGSYSFTAPDFSASQADREMSFNSGGQDGAPIKEYTMMPSQASVGQESAQFDYSKGTAHIFEGTSANTIYNNSPGSPSTSGNINTFGSTNSSGGGRQSYQPQNNTPFINIPDNNRF